ncbi:outer membrane transport energization protein TonB [Thalassovita litoralis]|jgi:protein TonB|uniref:Outer membrane transport energization protein TonB n=1 Tax=Thalassovita litoralis TaxID=1010611 RepID=A0A521CB76_9RHOB|nr:TonB family protein [Thalassovita litoralis]SMO56000.1 outer membrane transport energization protein TonB [Thalassovita litoralis]
MIVATKRAKLAALTVALTVHGALAMQLAPKPAVLAEASDGAAEARIGGSFEDMAVGTLASRVATDVVSPMPVAAQTPLVMEPVAPAALAAIPAPMAAKPQRPVQAKPVKPVEVAHPPKVQQATKETPRPKPRAEPLVKPTSTVTAKAGNAKVNARAGSATGTKDAKAKRQGVTKAKGTESGNAAVSNYPGVVMRRIARVPRPRVRSPGAAVVVFAVAQSGQLSSVSLGRSSGSSHLDQAALRLVRQAAPFPAPPKGAQRRFSIRIEGR